MSLTLAFLNGPGCARYSAGIPGMGKAGRVYTGIYRRYGKYSVYTGIYGVLGPLYGLPAPRRRATVTARRASPTAARRGARRFR